MIREWFLLTVVWVDCSCSLLCCVSEPPIAEPGLCSVLRVTLAAVLMASGDFRHAENVHKHPALTHTEAPRHVIAILRPTWLCLRGMFMLQQLTQIVINHKTPCILQPVAIGACTGTCRCSLLDLDLDM